MESEIQTKQRETLESQPWNSTVEAQAHFAEELFLSILWTTKIAPWQNGEPASKIMRLCALKAGRAWMLAVPKEMLAERDQAVCQLISLVYFDGGLELRG